METVYMTFIGIMQFNASTHFVLFAFPVILFSYGFNMLRKGN